MIGVFIKNGKKKLINNNINFSIEKKVEKKTFLNIGDRSGTKINHFILDNLVGIPKLTEKLKKKYDKIINNINKISNGNNIENWKNLIKELSNEKDILGIKQLNLIAGILDYSEYLGHKDNNKAKFKENLKIKLGNYNIEGTDDILHILTSACLSYKFGDYLTLTFGKSKELYKDNPSKQKIFREAMLEIEKINDEILELKEKYTNIGYTTNISSQFIKLEKKIKLLSKGSITEIMNDSIHDMKSNIVGILLNEYLEKNPEKTIYDFFIHFKNNNELQKKFNKLQKSEGLKIENGKLIKEREQLKYPISMMIN